MVRPSYMVVENGLNNILEKDNKEKKTRTDRRQIKVVSSVYYEHFVTV